MLSVNARKLLVGVALGRIAPDLVLTNALLVNVLTREIRASDVAIRMGAFSTERMAILEAVLAHGDEAEIHGGCLH